MLQFFRKHQKIFFAIVAFFIIISFSFFGTSGAVMNHEKVSDKEIGTLIDGSVLKEQRFYGLLRLLQHGIEEGGRDVNFLSDSAVHKDLLLTGLGQILAEHRIVELEEELVQRWKRMKNYTPYVHPNAPQINARAIWSQMAPEINELLDEVRKAPEAFSMEQLPLLFKLYSAQAEFPQGHLLQMLYYQQMQGGVRPDPGLPNANVGLFGFQSVEDWFGPQFVEEIGRLILNCACIAREEGYRVDKEEAHIDLLCNVYSALKLYDPENIPTNEQAQNIFASQVRRLGLTETEAISLWQEVLTFRRLFHEVGESVFIDRLALESFKEYAKPLCKIKTYSLPYELIFQDRSEQLQFEKYCELACEGGMPPTKVKESEQILEDAPQLLFKPFKVEMAQVTKGEVAARISLKETWDWESDKEHFSHLQEEFPVLQGKDSDTVEQRVAALDALGQANRSTVDRFARKCIVESYPEWIEEALAHAEREKKTLKVRLAGGETVFSGEEFLGLLETEDPKLHCYSLDQDHYYQIQIVEKGTGWHLLDYSELKRDGTLLAMTEDDEDTEPVETTTHSPFAHYLEEMRILAMQNQEVFQQAQKESLWPLLEGDEQLAEEQINVELGAFSPVEHNRFYQFIEKEKAMASDEEIAEAKKYLKIDAEQKLMRKLLKRIDRAGIS